MQMCIKKFLFLLLCACNSESVISGSVSPVISSLLLTMHCIPTSVSFPFGFLFNSRRGRDDIDSKVTDRPTTSRTPLYYKVATRLLDWAFTELDKDSEENDSAMDFAGFDPDKMGSSSEEEDKTPKKTRKNKEKKRMDLNKMEDQLDYLRTGRIERPTQRPSKAKTKKTAKKAKKDSVVGKRPGSAFKPALVEYDESVEQASLPELKHKLNQMKHEEEGGGVFNSLFSNSLTGPILSLGTTIFKTMYCSFRARSAYCMPQHFQHNSGGPGSIFEGSYRHHSIPPFARKEND